MRQLALSALGAGINASFENPGAGITHLKAYKDPLGIWTIGEGIIEIDGRPVNSADRLTPGQAKMLNAKTRKSFEKAVNEAATRALKQHEFDALYLFAYNVGKGALNSSTLLKDANARRNHDAAHEFGKWIYGTVESRVNRATGEIEWEQGPHGDPLEIGQQWKRALRGLVRRRYREACHYLGYDGTVACHDDNIELRVTSVFDENWVNPTSGKTVGRWKDRVDYVTPFNDILAIAEKHPLENLGPAKREIFKSSQPEIDPATLPAKKVDPVATIPKESLPPKIDPKNPAKRMEKSERFFGQFLITLGLILKNSAARIGAVFGGGGSMVATTFVDLVNNPQALALMVGALAATWFAVQWLIGELLDRRGQVVRQRGEATATQYLT